uniref:Uncharacterized protein n=1 Tax=Magallana gigas TaxID=29159 RepID=A0A8W8L1B9_MAGGI
MNEEGNGDLAMNFDHDCNTEKSGLEDVDSCPYFSINPPRLEESLNNELHFLSDPVLKNGEYKSFEAVYGIETDD